MIQRWRRTYPQVIAYGKRLAALAEVVTASGRRIPADPARPYANANYAVQSTARDLLLAAVYTLVTRYEVGGLWLFVHDEIIVQAPEPDAERVRGLLERAMTSTFRGLPIMADAKILGPAWGQHDSAAPAPGKSGTSGTSGTCAGQHGSGGFRRVAEVPEPPEPAEPSPPQPRRRVLVTGSRTWTDEAAIAAALRQHWDGAAVLVSGACPRGADAIAERLWTGWGGQVERHPADWASGRDAGMRRNAAMVAAGADICLAFIRDHSPGASHTARLAEHAGIPVRRYTHPQEVTMAPQPPAASPGTAALLNAARWCADRGWHVFPLRPGDKRPAFPGHKAEDCTGTDLRCRGGHQGWEPRATTDPGRIGRAWARTPYNIGLACGPSGLLVIDLDHAQARRGAPAAMGAARGHRWRGRARRAVRAARPALPVRDVHGADPPRRAAPVLHRPARPAARQHHGPQRTRARLAHRHPRARRLRGRARLVRGPARRHRPLSGDPRPAPGPAAGLARRPAHRPARKSPDLSAVRPRRSGP